MESTHLGPTQFSYLPTHIAHLFRYGIILWNARLAGVRRYLQLPQHALCFAKSAGIKALDTAFPFKMLGSIDGQVGRLTGIG